MRRTVPISLNVLPDEDLEASNLAHMPSHLDPLVKSLE